MIDNICNGLYMPSRKINKLLELYVSFFRKGCSHLLRLVRETFGLLPVLYSHRLLYLVLIKLFSSSDYIEVKSMSKNFLCRNFYNNKVISVGGCNLDITRHPLDNLSLSSLSISKVRALRRKLKYYFSNKVSSPVYLGNNIKLIYGRDRDQYQRRACNIIFHFFRGEERVVYSKLLKKNLYYKGIRFSKNYLDLKKRINLVDDVTCYGYKEFNFLVKNGNLSLSKKFLLFSKSSSYSYSSIIRNRCYYTSRSNSVFRFFKFSRIIMKQLADEGKLVGITKVD